MDPEQRYRGYLARFGITEPGERLLDFAGLAVGPLRFYAYADAGGLRLKAATVPSGLLAGGDEPVGDWHGFLTAMSDGPTAAERLAWLRSDESATAHGIPPPPVRVLHPGDVPPGVDPAAVASVTEPILAADDDGVTFDAWLLNELVAERWRVRASPGGQAAVGRAPAAALPGAAD